MSMISEKAEAFSPLISHSPHSGDTSSQNKVPTLPLMVSAAHTAISSNSNEQSGERSSRILLLIAAFKLVKCLLLLAVAVGSLKLLNDDVARNVSHWIEALGVDPGNRYIHDLLMKLTRVDNRKLEEISVGSFLYAALFFTEGTGLLLRKRWAEYLTIFATGSLLPLEIYELVRHFSAAKLVILIANVAVVVYLIMRVRKEAPRNHTN